MQVLHNVSRSIDVLPSSNVALPLLLPPNPALPNTKAQRASTGHHLYKILHRGLGLPGCAWKPRQGHARVKWYLILSMTLITTRNWLKDCKQIGKTEAGFKELKNWDASKEKLKTGTEEIRYTVAKTLFGREKTSMVVLLCFWGGEGNRTEDYAWFGWK